MTPPTEKLNSCAECKYWQRLSDTSIEGLCLRYAPHPVPISGSSKDILHPHTFETDRCGDFVKL